MDRWQREAEFVQKLKNEDEKICFGEDCEPEECVRRDDFVRKWGFSYMDRFDLDKEIAMFMLPRIAYFRDECQGYPSCLSDKDEDGNIIDDGAGKQKWHDILTTICDGLHIYLEKMQYSFTEEEEQLWQRAKKYLLEYFELLWS